MADLLTGLPGEAVVRAGLSDVAAGRRTTAALLVSVARIRFTRAGLWPHDDDTLQVAEPEHALYEHLGRQGGNAYSRYNALLRELASFFRALSQRQDRSRRVDAMTR